VAQDWQEYSAETHDIWEQNAAFWDDYMGEGNQFQRLLIAPTAERLLDVKPDDLVLEIACGNGSFARRLASAGARVVATDFSAAFIERAAVRTTEHRDRIEYRVVDAVDPQQLVTLGADRFDAVICNMALMDMASIAPLMEALPSLLKRGARFVFSVLHPCFNSVYSSKLVEEEDRDGELLIRYAVKVTGYITEAARKGLGVIGQPAPHYYFHRPLSVLLAACFSAGFAVDAFEEPTFDAAAEPNRPFSWANFREIPPAVVVRCRLSR
jgi:2-polyprenyl-3-methyl-5-hydroxy-6-metoxy-1,4-benzoquinol methylase